MSPTIWLAGDSIMQEYGEVGADQGDEFIQRGWGEYLSAQIHKETGGLMPPCQVHNLAMGGRSSRTFIEEGRLEKIEKGMKEGDLLLIQFGHNDASVSRPERYVAPEEFPLYLMKYIETAREKSGIPVLVSSVIPYPEVATSRGEVGDISERLPDYAEAMGSLAEREKLQYINMREITRRQCMGDPKQSRSYYMPDGVHLTAEGAVFCAEIAANALCRAGLIGHDRYILETR